MDNKRALRWLIPFLYGVSVGILIAWGAEAWLPVRDAVSKYVSQFGIAVLLIVTLLKVRTGYKWPWEGAAEWAEPQQIWTKAVWRNFVLWLILVLLLLAFFTLWQFPGFR
jgi:hypothetical protein